MLWTGIYLPHSKGRSYNWKTFNISCCTTSSAVPAAAAHVYSGCILLFSSALATTTFASTQAESKSGWTGFRIKSIVHTWLLHKCTVYSVVQLSIGHGNTNQTCHTPLLSTVELRPHPSSLPHPNPVLSYFGLRPHPTPLIRLFQIGQISHATKNN
jgi:hypothetical protein